MMPPSPSVLLPPAVVTVATWWSAAASAIAFGVALWLLLPGHTHRVRWLGAAVGALALGLISFTVVRITNPLGDGVFLALSATTVVSAAGAVTMRSSMYCAIWFALTLLATAALFLVMGAQFLGVATIVVYAGAILVTFLFVIMLAHPEGQARYDRVSWDSFTSAMAGGVLVGLLTAAVFASSTPPADAAIAAWLPPDTVATESRAAEILRGDHMARLGGILFSRHLLAVEIGGTLLLAALVGAIAFASQAGHAPFGAGGLRRE